MFRVFSLSMVFVLSLISVLIASEQKIVNIPVDIYGVVHVSADAVDNERNNGQYLSSNSSRIGFKGDVPIQGSFKALWQIESQVNIDSKTSGGSTQLLSLRDTFVGLDGSCGTVKFGHMDSPMKLIRSKTDMFSDKIGDARNFTDNKTAIGWDNRVDNDIMYITPTWRGIRGMISRSLDEGVKNKETTSLSIDYTLKSLYLAAAFERHDKALTTSGTDSEDGFRLGASYSIKNFTISGLYQQLYDLNGVNGANRDTYGAGVSYTKDKNVLKVQYYIADDLSNTGNTGSDMIVVGVDHNFTNRTTGYVCYALTNNDNLANYNVTGGGHGDVMTVANGEDINGISAGFILKF